MKTRLHHGYGFVAVILLALANSSCGGHSTTTTSAIPSGSTSDCYSLGTCLPTGTPTSSPLDPPTTPSEFEGATQLNFSLNGTGSGNESFTSAAFTTDNKFKIRIHALPAGTNTSGGNGSAQYLCAGYTVTVLGQAVDTKPLAVSGGVAGMCQNTGDQVIDFSSRLNPGHGPVTITVSKPRYDWYCMLYVYYPWMMGGTSTMYCPLHSVYQYHTVQGEIQVLVNGT